MKYALALIIILISFCVNAQQVDNSTTKREPHFIIKWSPLHLLNHYATLQFALEQRIHKNYSIQYDFGPVVKSLFGEEDRDFINKRGFKAKLELRHYFVNEDKLWRFFAASEFYYNYVNYNKSDSYGVNCEDGSCDYFRYYQYKMKYREPGINLKGGVRFKRDRISVDFQFGFALRIIRYTPIGKVESRSQFWEDDEGGFGPDLGIQETNRERLTPTTCIRIGYVIKK